MLYSICSFFIGKVVTVAYKMMVSLLDKKRCNNMYMNLMMQF